MQALMSSGARPAGSAQLRNKVAFAGTSGKRLWKKERSQRENTKLPIRTPRAALLYIRSKWEGKNKKGRAEWLRITGSILTPESSKNQGAFLARNSVAVAPAFAHCTNRCTRRKVTVTAQSTKQENRKMKKRSQHENTKLPIRSPRAALLLLSQSFWW